MPGRPPWSTPGTRDSSERLASEITTSKQKATKRKTWSWSTSVDPSNDEVTELYAPSGTIWNVLGVSFHVDADPDATGGSHLFWVTNLGGEWYEAAIEGKSNYDSQLRLSNNVWRVADSDTKPADESAQALQAQSLRVSESDPLKLVYRNNCDVAQENTRKFALAVIEEKIA